MKPQVYPETRGSHLAGQLERERALKRLVMAKSRKQRDIEKRQRKARNKRRREQQRKEAKREEAVMEQQSFPEQKQPKRKVEMIQQGKIHGPLKECFHHFGGTALATYWHEHGFWSRAKSDPVGAARKLIAARAANPKQTSNRPVHECLRKLVQHFAPQLQSDGSGTLETSGNALDERLRKIEEAQAVQADTNERLDKLTGLVEKFVSSQLQLPDKKAEVRVLHARKHIRRIVQATGVAAGDYDLRWDRLYSEAQFRWGIRWTKLAADCGIDAEGSGWKLDVAEKTGRIEALLEIAKEMFSQEAAERRN